MSGPSDSLRRLSGVFERLVDALRIDEQPARPCESGAEPPEPPKGQSKEGLISEEHSETGLSVVTFLGKVERDLYGLSDKTEEPK